MRDALRRLAAALNDVPQLICWGCIRRGHRLRCMIDGHLCTRCGRTWC